MKKYVALATTAAALVLAAPADAALLQYVISGVDINTSPGTTVEFASFQIDSNPVPNVVVAGQGFQINSVPGIYRYGTTTAPSPQNISFYTPAFSGGLFVGTGTVLAFDGPQLYTGTEAAPVMKTGVFTLTDYYSGSPITLTVTPVIGTVPEASTWALMIGGFGLVGGVLRTRRTSVRFAKA